jgi:plasmid stabilization system protein ParE
MAYRLTRRARRDVLSIWNRIAKDSESTADHFIDLLVHHFRILGDVPYAGRQRDELRTGYPGVRIMNVVHGRMDLKRYPF